MAMKYTSCITIIIFSTALSVSAQYKVIPNKPYANLSTSSGFVTINEGTYGLGLSGKTFPFSKHFFGFTTVNGYQVNQNFILAAGTGFYIYESGLLIPLFLDFRYAFYINQLSPYLFSDGGLLINVSKLDNTKLFINPGVGVRYALSRNLALNLGAGILAQVDGTVRESFLNLKLGAVYKF
jgi:hypothetical protein